MGMNFAGKRLQVHAQLRFPLNSLFTSGDRQEMSCKQPRHLTKLTSESFRGQWMAKLNLDVTWVHRNERNN